ncbi:ABC-F family ATP-binding cassette domain-containing protein [Paragemmobacter straminiformis]|uniref:ABC-F family ATP-binding cassette domain-containing protein n=1 Tax=Paragemmobacter straminiformis TaxID=2045119 RepID=A0A842I5G1_9RHOB|nr:ABC-F family ATP-binding cassette domain-containing protein [Gemmobacter straminiformis]MBC2834607.1 ABC-F family ATP-binding cassette domain-containing protein [Gemmobacter straminiformis]
MPASVSLFRLSYSTPDRDPVFTDLDLGFGCERTGIVGRNGAGKSTLLRLIAGDLAPSSGQVHIKGSVAMMRQDAVDRPEATVADLFGLRAALERVARAEAGQADADLLADTDWTAPARIEAALQRCGLSVAPLTPLAALSGGQRTRAALASVIMAEPDFLLLDEPTNNLDRAGREAVAELLRGWARGAIVASHDRTLLAEMDAIVELSALGAARYGGSLSDFRLRKKTEREAAQRDLAHAEKTRDAAARRAQDAQERKNRKDGAGHRARAKGGQSKIQFDFAKGRAEASDSAGARLRDARRDAADAALSEAREKIEIMQPLRMDIAPTGLPEGKTVLRLDRLTGGYDPHHPVIRDLSLTVTGPERIAIAGPNGSGKTTLLGLITGQLAPMRGRVEVSVPFALLDQHVGMLAPERTLSGNFRHLNPAADARMAHAALARFGFRAADARRRAAGLSGGERLRAGLACALGATPPPMLLILDEPTNHLDLDSLAALEAALAAYDGAVLIVSHDDAFVRSVAPDRVIELPSRPAA